MNLISILILAFIIRQISGQALSDSKSENIDFYTEVLYPAFRRHRARLRPFSSLLGAPINRIRGTRDLKKLSKFEDECIFSMDTIFCSGYDPEGSKIEVNCDANMKLGFYKALNEFYVGKLKLNSNDSKFKLNLHNSKNYEQILISISNESSDLNKHGIFIKNDVCWSSLIKFFVQILQRKFINHEFDLTPLKIL